MERLSSPLLISKPDSSVELSLHVRMVVACACEQERPSASAMVVEHRHAQVRVWCEVNGVELVFLPTYGSWLNWIEAEFATLRYFALNGTDHHSHTEQHATIARLRPLAQHPNTPEGQLRSRLPG